MIKNTIGYSDNHNHVFSQSITGRISSVFNSVKIFENRVLAALTYFLPLKFPVYIAYEIKLVHILHGPSLTVYT